MQVFLGCLSTLIVFPWLDVFLSSFRSSGLSNCCVFACLFSYIEFRSHRSMWSYLSLNREFVEYGVLNVEEKRGVVNDIQHDYYAVSELESLTIFDLINEPEKPCLVRVFAHW